jgi:2,5-diketo-D-gluconate reductase A
MEYTELSNGVKMPLLGFGVYQITDPAECERSVLHALAAGYRLIDTAAIYGNEEAVGRAIKKSGVPREELFITTKIWISDAGYESGKRAFEQSLKRLGLDYLDLYLIHQPFSDYYGSWRAMEELYEAGRIRAIGVANFMPDRLTDLAMHAKVVPHVDQVEINPFCQRFDDIKVMQKYHVQPQSWGSFAEGRNNLFKNPVLNEIGRAHGKSAAQVTLRYLLDRKIVCIPKSVHKERIEQNINVFDFKLTDEEKKAHCRARYGQELLLLPLRPGCRRNDRRHQDAAVRALS